MHLHVYYLTLQYYLLARLFQLFFVTMELNRLVVQKYFERGLSGAQIFRHVKQIGITRDCVYRTIRRLHDTESVQERPR